jgi:hypothetical protein
MTVFKKKENKKKEKKRKEKEKKNEMVKALLTFRESEQ